MKELVGPRMCCLVDHVLINESGILLDTVRARRAIQTETKELLGPKMCCLVDHVLINESGILLNTVRARRHPDRGVVVNRR